MNYKKIIKQQPISVGIIILIWIVCMIPVPETPLSNVSLIDKWAHVIMFGSLALIIILEYTFRIDKKIKPLLIRGMVIPIIMGGLVELAQAYLTCSTRSGEWLDFLADSIGVVIGCIIGIPLAQFLATRNKDA